MERVSNDESLRRRDLVYRLGNGSSLAGWRVMLQIAADEGFKIPSSPIFNAGSPELVPVFDIAERLCSAQADTATGGPAFSGDHMRYFTQARRQAVATSIESMGLSWANPSIDPFPFLATETWFERVRGHGEILSPFRKSPLPDSVRADFDGLQIVLLTDGNVTYGWVGVDGYGFIDRFRTDRTLPEAIPATNVGRIVLGLAYAWAIDLQLETNLRRPALLNMAVSEGVHGVNTYAADEVFRRQVSEARSTVDPSVRAAHWRRSHLRVIDGTASQEKIATAPPRFRSEVGEGVTWVIGTKIGNDVRRLITHLLNRTLIADSIGLTYPRITASCREDSDLEGTPSTR